MATETATRGRSEIEADIVVALHRMRRAASAGYWTAVALFAVMAWIAVKRGDWGILLAAAPGLAATVVLAYAVRRGSQIAAIALLLGFLALVAVAWVASDHAIGVIGALFLGYRLFEGVRGAFALAALKREYVAAPGPRTPVAGDVYTVKDGEQFGVAKVLAVGDDLVHVRLYPARFTDRPTDVGAPIPDRGDRDSATPFDHLPLDTHQFATWEPRYVRSDDVLPEELNGYASWQRVQQQ